MTLTPVEAGMVLHAASQADNRSWDETTALAWSHMIDPIVTLSDALAAVAEHYRNQTTWLMPAHLNAIVSNGRFRVKQRLLTHGEPDFPSGLDAAGERDYRIRYQTWLLRGADHKEATTRADEDMEIDRGELVPAPPEFRAQLDAMNAKRGLDYSRKVGY